MIAAALLLAVTPPPKIEIPVAPAPPPSETYGDWTVIKFDKNSTIASTKNNAGSVFGTICEVDGCEAFFNLQTTCTDGNSYPALINAPAGGYAVELKCVKWDKTFLYAVVLEGGIADAMSVGGELGIAFPLQSGRFQVARFSLTGSARASARAAQVARGTTPERKQQASDNQTL